MSDDVIEAMAAAMSANHAEGTDEELASDVRAALRAAEQAGWRLVPVEPTLEMVKEAGLKWIGYPAKDVLSVAIQAAPRPWAEQEQSDA